jgi:hypothetical protein
MLAVRLPKTKNYRTESHGRCALSTGNCKTGRNRTCYIMSQKGMKWLAKEQNITVKDRTPPVKKKDKILKLVSSFRERTKYGGQ